MLLDIATADPELGAPSSAPAAPRWGVGSEYGRLTDVLLARPDFLEMVPCNSVAIEKLAEGLSCCPAEAAVQHLELQRALAEAGVRCHVVGPEEGLADLCFTRDTCVMSPWGLIELAPAAGHRRAEAAYVREAARRLGVPVLGRVAEGLVEGGDVCVLRPGVIVVGWSGDRTTEAGARALAAIFEAHGWHAIFYRFDPEFLHLDTQFTMIDRTRALACVEALSPDFIAAIEELGIELVPVTREEVRRLGGNVLSLGDGRILSSADNVRVNAALRRLGYSVSAVEIGQFVRCGGGIHCLTLPLAREAAPTGTLAPLCEGSGKVIEGIGGG